MALPRGESFWVKTSEALLRFRRPKVGRRLYMKKKGDNLSSQYIPQWRGNRLSC